MKKLLNIIVALFFICPTISAQELNCRVNVNYSSIGISESPVFQTLQKDITAFMNERRWTNHAYLQNERIECSILITLSEYNGIDKFTGTIQVNMSRPIYMTSYNTPLLTFKEGDNKFVFKYIEGQPLEYVENVFTNNLTQVLAYYAYIILGYDYDTFSTLGGTEFYRKAFRIVLNSQTSGYEGWGTADTKQNSRYNFVEALLDKRFEPLRIAQYQYHRLGLDLMPTEPENARKQMVNALKNIQKASRAKSNSLIVSMFFTAKCDELINIFSASPTAEKNEVLQILKEVDVSNYTKYQKISAQ